MPTADDLKEQLAYCRFWLAVLFVTNIGLVSWLITIGDDTDRQTLITVIAFAVLMLIAGIPLHMVWRSRNRY